MQGNVRRLGVVVVVVGLVALSACGRSSGGKSATGDSKGLTGSQSAAGGNGAFGTMKAVCSSDSTGNTATGRGVTASSINLGVISDVGYAGKPGLNQELWDASDVFVKWCNSLGGIHGRKLIGTHLDAALTQYKQKVLVACQNSFALVGGGGVFDDTGEKARLSCLLPSFPGFLLTPVARGSAFKWQVTPAPLGQINTNTYKWIAEHFPDAKNSVGILTAGVAATISVSREIKEALGKLGFTLADYDEQFNALGEATWVPFATTMKAKGVKGLMYLGEPQDLGKLEQAMVAINYKPEFIVALPNANDPGFLTAANGAAFNTYITSSTYPFELADKKVPGSEAMQKYLSLFARYNPKGKVRSYLGVESFAAWLLFSQAASMCGAKLTQRCLYDSARTITRFDAGGLIAPANPAAGSVPTCSALLLANGRSFSVVDVKANQGAFYCDPKAGMRLSGDYGRGLGLTDVGKTLNDLK